jgi:hypothetical protein
MTPHFRIAAITDEFSPDLETAVRSMAEIGMTGAELRTLSGKNIVDLTDDELDRAIALVRADLGGHGWLAPGPELPRERGPAWRHLYVYAYLALVDVVTGYHRDHGIADAVSWVTLADLGRNLAIDRRMHREGWPVMQSWLTLHARGGIYELGRLQHHRGGTAIHLHIPESGPMTPEAVAASLDEARAFFPRHFPDERYTAFSCGSWLLDPQLLEYLPGDSNIVRFQRRLELEPYEEPEGLDGDVEVLRFVFRTLTTPLDQLPRRTVLQRAIVNPPEGRPPLARPPRPLPDLATPLFREAVVVKCRACPADHVTTRLRRWNA